MADPQVHTGLLIGLSEENLRQVGDQPTAEKSSESSESCVFSVRFSCEWIWQTRLSETPRISPISRSVRFLT
jgi:hypothetical protein